MSRRTTFKEYLQNRLSDEYQFLRPLHRSIFERETLLIPRAYSQHVLGELHYQGATPLEAVLVQNILTTIHKIQERK
jgi:hypothetical protein